LEHPWESPKEKRGKKKAKFHPQKSRRSPLSGKKEEPTNILRLHTEGSHLGRNPVGKHEPSALGFSGKKRNIIMGKDRERSTWERARLKIRSRTNHLKKHFQRMEKGLRAKPKKEQNGGGFWGRQSFLEQVP